MESLTNNQDCDNGQDYAEKMYHVSDQLVVFSQLLCRSVGKTTTSSRKLVTASLQSLSLCLGLIDTNHELAFNAILLLARCYIILNAKIGRIPTSMMQFHFNKHLSKFSEQQISLITSICPSLKRSPNVVPSSNIKLSLKRNDHQTMLGKRHPKQKTEEKP